MFSKIKSNLFFSIALVFSIVLFLTIGYLGVVLPESEKPTYSILVSFELLLFLISIYTFRKVFLSGNNTFQILISEPNDSKQYATVEINILIIGAMFLSMGIMARPTDTMYSQALSLQILELWIMSTVFFLIGAYVVFKKAIDFKTTADSTLLKP